MIKNTIEKIKNKIKSQVKQPLFFALTLKLCKEENEMKCYVFLPWSNKQINK